MRSKFEIVTFTVILLGLAGCSSGIDDNNGQQSPRAAPLSLLIANDTDKVTIAWLPSPDDRTAAAAIKYRAHASTTANFIPGSNTQQMELTGETSAIVENLVAATEYFFLVEAVDEAGNVSVNNQYRSATTASVPIKRSAQPIQMADDLNLFDPDIAGTTYT